MQVILAQALLGLNVGVFYAMLSLGLAVIFGLLNIINFAHGAMYMLGAFIALIGYSYLEQWFGISLQIGFWGSLIVAPLVVGLLGIIIARTMLKRLADLDHIYGLLLTFGITLILQGLFANYFNVSGTPYPGQPEVLGGGRRRGVTGKDCLPCHEQDRRRTRDSFRSCRSHRRQFHRDRPRRRRRCPSPG